MDDFPAIRFDPYNLFDVGFPAMLTKISVAIDS